jgi:UDP-N-acetylmuramate: L-alanyl-gamma-D-glutamyl-meso-diaminopimelate ligase
LNVKHCPVARFGLAEGNDRRAAKLELEGERSRFELDGEQYEIPLTGELNVRNALAVAACALRCGFQPAQIRAAFATFTGIKRRMETRGEAGGITVIDDFGHHPTAIRETIRALRVRFPGRRLWAIFEPRTNTTRRNVFQRELAEALKLADGTVVSQVARLELLKPEERLDPALLMREISGDGKPAAYLATVEEIIQHMGMETRTGDVVAVFSNGGFGGIHDRLLERFKSK